MKHFSEIKTRRLALNLTQVELGTLFDVDGNTIARWERGESKPPLGLINLAFETLELREALQNSDLQKLKAKVSAEIGNSLNKARQRVRHLKA